MTAGLHHPHIVTLLPQQVTHIGAQIASALEAVHAEGIVHRDVKPGNVLVTDDGTAKLTDFGISRPICGDVTVTDSAVIGGTVAFLASEVAGGEDATPASDVFALGATLFAAVEGTPPFGTADNPLIVLRRAAAGEVLPCRRAGPLAPVLSALLQPDPANRPDAAWARQMLQELAATGNGSEPVPWPVGGSGRSRRFWRRAVVIALACVAVLGTVTGLVLSRPDGSPMTAIPLAVIGDPRTADPCALTDPATLRRFGATIRATAYANFNRCDVLVTSSGGNPQVDVLVEFEKPGPSEGKMERMGPVQVFRKPETDGRCKRTVLLADMNRVVIIAKPESTLGSANLCAMADVATDHAVAVLSKGATPRRSAPPGAASLARMDACALLDSPALSRVLGAGVSRPEAGFGNWKCRWDSSTSELSVNLSFDRNEPRASAIKLAGRDAYVTPYAKKPDCDAEIFHRKDLDANGSAVDEMLVITVGGPRPLDQLCEPARELVQAAAANLPPPR